MKKTLFNFNFISYYIFSFLLIVIFCSIQTTISLAQVKVPSGFADELFSSGWTDITTIAFDSAGRIYVGEHEGTIWRADANGAKSGTPIINLREEIGWWNAHGLLNFILDKDFLNNGYIYLYYTVDRHHLLYYGTPQYNSNVNDYHTATIDRVTRYQLDASTNFTTVVPGSRFVLVGDTKKNGIPMTYNVHDGGGMAMALDGTLLIGTGDGGHGGVIDTGSNSQTYYLQALADSIIEPATNVGAYRAQLLQSMNGKILRIDPMTGLGVSSNPFYDSQNPASTESKIWALGLRQPFRLTIRPGTGSTNPINADPGAIYVAEVGYFNWEEMEVINGPAQNLGWPVYEGLFKHSQYGSYEVMNLNAPNPLYGSGGCSLPYFRFIDLIVNDTIGPPLWYNPCDNSQQIPPTVNRWKLKRSSFSYSHVDLNTYIPLFDGTSPTYAQLGASGSNTSGIPFNGNCIAGTGFNKWNDWPSKYRGANYFCDFDKGFINYAKYDSQQNLVSIDTFASGLGRPITIAWHPTQHCIYYIDYQFNIHRIRYTIGTNIQPIAVARQNIKYGPGPLTVNFSAADSYDPDGGPLTYSWSFGNGAVSTKSNPTRTFYPPNSKPTKYIVKLKVTDTGGLSDSTELIVSVNNTPPVVNITSPIDGTYYSSAVSQVYNMTAAVSDAEHNANQLHYFWYTAMHHNAHEHPNPPDTDKTSYMITDPEDCENTYYYEVRLTVTDDAGLSTTDTVKLYQNCLPAANFQSSDDTICLGTTVQFTDKSKRFPNAWSWTFAGGNPATSNAQNPVVTYSTAGNYNVTLISSTPSGSDTIIKAACIKVKGLPGATITAAGPTSFCTGGAVTLNANVASTYTYQWEKDNIDINGATGTSYTANAAGSYSVRETNKFGCTKESKVVQVSIPLIASITANGPTTFCAGGNVLLSALPKGTGYTYQWTKNNVNINGATSVNYTASAAGNYRVIVTAGAGCTNLSTKQTVTINCRDGMPINIDELVKIYPNPTASGFTIEPSENMPDYYNLEVREITGRLILSDKSISTRHPYNFGEDLSEGIYFLKIFYGDHTQVVRLVKTR